ncbi:MAG: tyrosine-type recombinase/integrase [Thiobacillus sp.]
MSLYKRKDSSAWWLKIRHNGQAIQRSTGTDDKLKAQEYHDRLKASLWEQSRLGVKPQRTWQEAVLRWITETSDKRTHQEDLVKLKWLHTHLGQHHLDDITLDVIDTIRVARLKEGTKSTCNRYLALVRAILRRARDDWEWLDKVPKVKLYKEADGRERALTPQEAKRLLDELPTHLRDMALFALLTGLRQANVLGLEWSKVDLERGHAWVASSASKNRQPISVPLNQGATELLLCQVGKHPKRVFTYKGKPITNANTRAWREALTRAEIEDFRWHDLRHTWATWHRRAGTPTHELQRLGGWRTASMVERYAHLASDHLAESAARLGSVVDGYDLATVSNK